MGGSGKKIGQSVVNFSEKNAPPAKAEKAAAEGVAKEMARRDAFAKAQQEEPVTVTTPTTTPATTPATPVAPPAEPVAQQMVNATPVKGAAMNSNVVAAANPVALPGAMKAASGPAVGAGTSAAPRQAAAAAQQANQTSSGANQFMAPSINGLTFGGS